VCLSTGHPPGCDCYYIPACNGIRTTLPKNGGPFTENPFAGPWTTRMPTTPDLDFGRRSNLIGNGYYSAWQPLQDMFVNVTDDVHGDELDFLSYRGCRGRLEQLQNGNLLDFPEVAGNMSYPTGNPVGQSSFRYVIDYARRMSSFAVARVTEAVPNFWERWDFVNRYQWSADDRAAYLAQLAPRTPEQALLDYLSPTGLALLKAMAPAEWDMLAVPVNASMLNLTELPQWRLVGAQRTIDGCEVGSAPQIAVDLTDGASGLRLGLSVVGVPPPSVTARVDWGDSVLEWVSLGGAQSENHTSATPPYTTSFFTHTYATAAVYAVRVTVMDNDSGLYATAVTYKRVASGVGTQPSTAPLAAVTRISLDLTLQGDNRGQAQLPIQVHASSVDRPDLVLPVTAANLQTMVPPANNWDKNYLNTSLAAAWAAADTVARINMSCRCYDNYLYARQSISLRAVRVQLYASEGQAPRTLTVVPSAANFFITALDGTDRATPATKDAAGLWNFYCARVDEETVTGSLDVAAELQRLGAVAQARSRAPDTPLDSLDGQQVIQVETRPQVWETVADFRSSAAPSQA
jgi:hypothetical protein